MIKKNTNKIIKNGFSRKFKISLLNLNFVMIYIIHKMIVSLKNDLNYLKDIIFECFLKEYSRLFFFFN